MLGNELLHGRLVVLTALTRADAPALAAWSHDAEYLRLFDADPAVPLNEERVIEHISELGKKKDHIGFALRRVSDQALIGVAELEDINWHHGNAWLAIGLGKPFWDQGLGTEAMQLVTRYAFQELNLHRVQLTVFAYNQRALAVYRKVGFIEEGRQREWVLRDGERYDLIFMGLLASEWRAAQHP